MRSKTSLQGFSAVEIVITLFVCLLIGAGGWTIWRQSKGTPRSNDNDANSSAQENPAQKKSEAKNSATEPPEPAKYLVIKEWNVRVSLPENLRGDITYFVNDRAEKLSGGPVLIDFVSKRFSAGNLKCAVIEGDVPRSIVSFYKEIENEGVETHEPESFKRIGDARYYFAGAACEDAIEKEGTEEDRQLLLDLKAAVQDTLEAN